MLHLRTFGGLSVDIDGTPGTGAAQQRKTLALLALLAAAGHRGLSRDKLIALLWPETDAGHGRGLLKQACYALRRDLHTPQLFLGSIQLRLNPAVIVSDVQSFASSLEQNDPSGAVSCYTAPFLDGFYLNGDGEFEAWAETERARLAGQYRAALELMAAEATGRGEHRTAAHWWRRILELDPMSSHAALGLMAALDNAGERAEALCCGQAYGEVVRSELGTDPPPELSRWIERHRQMAGNGSPGKEAAGPSAIGSGTTGSDPGGNDPGGSGIAGNGTAGYGTAGAVREDVSALERLIERAPARVPAEARRGSLVGLPRWGTALVLAVVAAAGVLLSRSRSDAPTDANLLAIAPFDVLDPSLQIWHEGLVDILSRDLDGAGPLRTVPQTVGIKRWNGRADRVSAASFGHRTGAGLVVFGSIGKARDGVSLRATVLDVARRTAEADLEVRGDTASMGDLADSLGVKILQALGRSRPIGSVRRVSIGSRSLPALKAFLYGEQFYRLGLWDSALVYYDQAIAQDSLFGLAFRKMSLAVDWNPSSASAYRSGEEYKRRAVMLGRGLPPRDSLLNAAGSLGIASEDATTPADLIRLTYREFSTIEEGVRRYPDDPEMWLGLGEARFHSLPPLGGVPAEALEAFDSVIALDPGFAPAYEHTLHLAIRLRRPDLARTYAAAYLRLDPTDVNAPSIRLAALMLDPERAHAPATAAAIGRASAQELFGAGMMNLGWWADSDETSIRLMRVLALRPGTGADAWSDTLMYRQFLALDLAYRGHLREAYAADRRLLLDPTASRFTNFLDPFRALALLGVIPDAVAAATFGQALEPGGAWPISLSYTARQLRGLPWWQARGDTVSLARFSRRAEQEARTQPTARGRLQSRYLHAAATAYLALARADSVRALGLFRSIADTLCIVNDCFYEKLTEARLLAAQGQAQQAGAILDRWVWSGGGPLFVLGVVEQARIAERLGERAKATQSYRFVADAWRRADPDLQPFVSEARSALARLTRE